MNNKKFIEKEFELFCQQDQIDIEKFGIKECRKLLLDNINEEEFNPCIIKKEIFKLNNENLGSIETFIFYPIDFKEEENKKYNIIYYLHGGGWCVEPDHKLPRELCDITNSIVIYPLYSLSPEAKYPKAVEECYELLCVLKDNDKIKLNFNELFVFGESAGGNLAITTTILCNERNGIKFKKLILFNPAVDYNFDRPSFSEYSNGYFLSKKEVKQFYSFYFNDVSETNDYLMCPLKTPIEKLSKFPETLIILAELDVLRDEGIEFYKKLISSKTKATCVTFPGTTHSFLSFHFLRNTNSSKNAIKVLSNFIKS